MYAVPGSKYSRCLLAVRPISVDFGHATKNTMKNACGKLKLCFFFRVTAVFELNLLKEKSCELSYG